jgi:hypothetical protein
VNHGFVSCEGPPCVDNSDGKRFWESDPWLVSIERELESAQTVSICCEGASTTSKQKVVG